MRETRVKEERLANEKEETVETSNKPGNTEEDASELKVDAGMFRARVLEENTAGHCGEELVERKEHGWQRSVFALPHGAGELREPGQDQIGLAAEELVDLVEKQGRVLLGVARWLGDEL